MNYLKFFPDEELPIEMDSSVRSSCLRVGAYMIIQKIIKEYKLDDMLHRIFGEQSGLFLDLVAYCIVTENNLAEYYPDYAYNHPLFTENMHIFSDAAVTDFLNEITTEQRLDFLEQWNRTKDQEKQIYVSLHSTNKSSQAGDVEIVEPDGSKNDRDLLMFNYSVVYDHENSEPLFYIEYTTSIVDNSQLQYMRESALEYGYQKVGFIFDRGRCTKEAIQFLDKFGYEFMIMAKGYKNLVKRMVVEKQGTFEDRRVHEIREYNTKGVSIKGPLYPSAEQDITFHIYYNRQASIYERDIIKSEMNRMATYLKKQEGTSAAFDGTVNPVNDPPGSKDQKSLIGRDPTDAIDKQSSLCGYFAMITSKEMTAQEALSFYKNRDESEQLFREDKFFLGNNNFFEQSDEPIDAKIFIQFVALIVRNKIYACLQKAMPTREDNAYGMTVSEAINELEKIELVRMPGQTYRLDHAITAHQKSILKAFGLKNDADIKKQARIICEQCNGPLFV